jgi:retron-type reverse transcriptase
MKSYKNLYPKLCSYKNLERAFLKARKGKSSKFYVQYFEKDITKNLVTLKKELETFSYIPTPLTRFVIRDPKTRVIRKSIFKDRVIHHAIVNILEPIYEKIFIHDSYANRLNKGTLKALQRFDVFKRKVSKNGSKISRAMNANMIQGYVLKADIKHFFNSVNQSKLLGILQRKIKDKKMLRLINVILKNYDDKKTGMPLGNMTSQFFANVYLNDLDYFIKKRLKMKYYVRYVDDFVVLHENKKILEECKKNIQKYLVNLRLELHPGKSKIYPLYKGINLLGFKVFYYYKRLRKRNLNYFYKRLKLLKIQCKEEVMSPKKFIESVEGWFGYIMWGDTYNLRKEIVKNIAAFFYFNKLKIKKSLEEIGKLGGPK